MIAFIPSLHAALKLRRPDLWCWFAGIAVGEIVAWILVGTGGNGDSPGAGGTIGALLALTLAVAGTYHALGLRSEVFGESDGVRRTAAALASIGNDPAVTRALNSRQRRVESLALAAKDSVLARDLMIGRPDLAREYDDGGLVDVNHVPESIFVSHVGLSPEEAHDVVRAREQVGRFESIEDMWNLANLPPGTIDVLRDRLIAL